MQDQLTISQAASSPSAFKAALMYVEFGISVLPVDGKKPALVRKHRDDEIRFNWTEFQTKVPPFSYIHNWMEKGFMKGVGVICGKVSGNLVVIDLDGLEAVKTFEAAFPELLDTYTVLSGSGKGKHIYFYVDELPPTTRTKGYELRADGCYVVAPPSLHPDTNKPYQIEKDIPIKRVPTLLQIVEWIKSMIHSKRNNLDVTPNRTRQPEMRQQPGSNNPAMTYLTKSLETVRGAQNGNRNDTLNRVSYNLGQLVSAGDLDRVTVEGELLNAARAVGLQDHEAIKTISSGLNSGEQSPRHFTPAHNGSVAPKTQHAAPDQAELKPDKPDDDEISREISSLWKESVAFFYSDWHKCENGVWIKRHPQEIKRGVRHMLANNGYRARGVNISNGRVNSITSMLEDDLFVPDRTINEQIEEVKQYIPLQNGLFNIESGELEEHRHDLYITAQLDFNYDPAATCPVWHKYISSSLVIPGTTTPDTEMIALLQEAMAYSLTARTEQKASFWLVGVPDGGKSTLIGFLRRLGGDLHGTIDLNLLGSNNFMVSRIVGKRIVTFTEAESNAVLPDSLYKALAGGDDEIFADVKNRPGISFVPTAKFWWGMNNAPRTTDRSGATFNRLYPIIFNRTILQGERIRNLPALLAKEKSGVFNWLLDGLERLTRQGKFTACTESARWKEAYILENDTEASFIQEWAELGNDYSVTGQYLYDQYSEWCNRNGFRPKNSNQAAREWERLGFSKTRKMGSSYWHGLRKKSVE